MHVIHYAYNLGAPGGINRYVQRLGEAQRRAGCTVEYAGWMPTASEDLRPYRAVASGEDLASMAHAAGADVLHLHGLVDLPPGKVPVVRTMHGNHGSCPGGERYLSVSGVPCTRAYSPAGCFWHRLTERCGSVRPHRFASDVARTRLEMKAATSIRTLVVSGFLRDQMAASGVDVRNVHVLPSAAPDLSHPMPPLDPAADEPSHFLFLGRLVPQKGLDWLLKALSRVDGDVRIDVAGEGPEGSLALYRRRADAFGLGERVTFHGWVRGDAFDALVRHARAVVVPSMWAEPAGLVTLEAAAYGRPVIASRAGGIPEYADPTFADLVNPGDVTELAAAIDRLAADPARATAMGRAGRALATTRFSMAAFLDGLSTHYDAVMTPAPA